MKPRLVYVCCEGFSSPVLEAQVIRVIEQLHERGRSFDLLLIGNIQTGLLSHKRNRVCLERIRPLVPGEIRFVYLLSFAFFSVAYARRRLARWLGADLRGGRPIVFHCRSEYAANIVSPFRRRCANVRMINDIRGEKLSEYDYRCRRSSAPWPQIARARKRRRFARWQAECTRAADCVLCVSEPLADYYKDAFPQDAGKVHVLRTGADEDRFCLSTVVRREIRERLGIQDRTVFVYSGSLAPYQMAPQTLRVFQAFHEMDPEAFLLFLTPRAEDARRLIESRGMDKRDVLVRSAPFEEVPSYLMAADVAILLRERLPINHYASPTKLGEYWLSGLPVLTTKGVSDALRHIEEHSEMGVVLDPEAPETWPSVYARLKAEYLDESRREDVRNEAVRRYSRARFLGAYEGILDGLLREMGADESVFPGGD